MIAKGYGFAMLKKMNRRQYEGPQNCECVWLNGNAHTHIVCNERNFNYVLLFISTVVCSCINNICFFSPILLLCSAVVKNTDLELNKMASFRLIPLVYFILEWNKFTYVNVLCPVFKYLRTNNKQDHEDLQKWL